MYMWHNEGRGIEMGLIIQSITFIYTFNILKSIHSHFDLYRYISWLSTEFFLKIPILLNQSILAEIPKKSKKVHYNESRERFLTYAQPRLYLLELTVKWQSFLHQHHICWSTTRRSWNSN